MVGIEVAKFLPPAEWFDRWWNPAEFAASVHTHKQDVPVVEFMCRPDLMALRESWAAATFSNILSQDRPVSICMEFDRFPDFKLRVRDELQLFELVEADREGRRRGKEYRDEAVRRAAGLPPELEGFDPSEEEQAAVPAIVRSIETKAAKQYRPSPHLLVYVNFWLDDDPPERIFDAVQTAERCRHAFVSTWLLWGAFIIRLWPNPAKIRDRASGG